MGAGVISTGEEYRSTQELRETDIHDVLSNERRRLTLEVLGEAPDAVSTRALSESVASLETGRSPAPRDIRQSVYVSLQQTHLPKLDDLDVIDYDADTKTVRPGENAADVGVYMEIVPKYGLAWSEYYVALGVLGAAILVAHRVGVPLVAAIDATVWGVLLFLAVALSAVYQTYAQRSFILHRLQ